MRKPIYLVVVGLVGLGACNSLEVLNSTWDHDAVQAIAADTAAADTDIADQDADTSVIPDTDVSDDVGPDTDTSPVLNACGGTAETLVRADEAFEFEIVGGGDIAPGASCTVDELDLGGDAGTSCPGVVRCLGIHTNEVECFGARPHNGCNGCGELWDEVGAACGRFGTWDCTDAGGLYCHDLTPLDIACGAADALADGAQPNQPCDGGAGLWRCTGLGEIECVANALSWCGSADDPPEGQSVPGTQCHTDAGEPGVVTCGDDPGEMYCEPYANAVGVCGGDVDGPSAGERCRVGTNGDASIGVSATWVCLDGQPQCEVTWGTCGSPVAGPDLHSNECDGNMDFYCNLDLIQRAEGCAPDGANDCGGLGELDHQPGENCGACGRGRYVCVAPNLTECVDPDDGHGEVPDGGACPWRQ